MLPDPLLNQQTAFGTRDVFENQQFGSICSRRCPKDKARDSRVAVCHSRVTLR